jgi:hypothetical protein
MLGSMRIFLSLFCCLYLLTSAVAQTTLQVVTKRIDKDFPYKEGYEVNIEGDRAEVYIESWNQSTIRVHLELVSKNVNREQAEQDLERMQYGATKEKNKIYLRNYFTSPDGADKPESQLKAVYRIYLPEKCPVYLKNNYGLANISNLINKLRINSRFSRIGLENIQGTMDINTQFGDLFGQNLNGEVNVVSRRSDITLKNMKGRYDINAQYGLLRLYAANEGLLGLDLHADKSQVFLYNTKLTSYSYDLTVQNGRIDYPNELKFKILDQKDPNIRKVTFRPNKEYYPNMTISITFGDLTIGK